MLPCDVVRWESFPFQKSGPAKARWFICFGKVTAFGQEAMFYLSTTTTKLDYYKPGGKREKNPTFRILKKDVPVFPEDCLVDLKLNAPDGHRESVIEQFFANIHRVGEMPKHTMSELFNALVRAGTVSRYVLQKLRQNLEEHGCKGLAKP